jgi:hypothetical protein
VNISRKSNDERHVVQSTDFCVSFDGPAGSGVAILLEVKMWGILFRLLHLMLHEALIAHIHQLSA